MNQNVLIFIDRLAGPFYALLLFSKSILPVKKSKSDALILLKFFGFGSLTRIAYVIERTGLDKENITLITLSKNKGLVSKLGLKAIYIKSKNPFVLLWSILQSIIIVWQQTGTKIIDMERASNISGIYRILISIRKPCASFVFAKSRFNKGSQSFVSLSQKPATEAITEILGETQIQPLKEGGQSKYKHRILVNVNAGSYLPERMFMPVQYADLISKLAIQFPNWQFELTGLQTEVNRVSRFEDILIEKGVPKARITNLAGQQNLQALLNRIESAQLIITNDSGPLHFAQWIGSKTVGIWGPTSARLVGYPNSKMMLNLEPNDSCHPCFIHPKSNVAKFCDGELTCFKTRNIDQMVDQIVQFVAY